MAQSQRYRSARAPALTRAMFCRAHSPSAFTGSAVRGRDRSVRSRRAAGSWGTLCASTKPSRSSPRNVVVSIFCEMPPIAASQFAEAHRAAAQIADHQHGPFVADAAQNVADRAAILAFVMETRFQKSASLRCCFCHSPI